MPVLCINLSWVGRFMVELLIEKLSFLYQSMPVYVAPLFACVESLSLVV